MDKAKKKLNTRAGGRPPLAEEDRRSIMIRVLATEAEHAVMLDAARDARVGISTWLRQVGMREAERHAEEKAGKLQKEAERAAALEKARGPGTV